MTDDRLVETCYAVLVVVSWVWASSQLRLAVQLGTGWRWTTAAWMVSKAVFFTIAASIWWFDEYRPVMFPIAVLALTVTHVIALVHWLLLPDVSLGPEVPSEHPS